MNNKHKNPVLRKLTTINGKMANSRNQSVEQLNHLIGLKKSNLSINKKKKSPKTFNYLNRKRIYINNKTIDKDLLSKIVSSLYKYKKCELIEFENNYFNINPIKALTKLVRKKFNFKIELVLKPNNIIKHNFRSQKYLKYLKSMNLQITL